MIYAKSYSELILLETFEDRFKYLQLQGVVGADTFGSNRYLNQLLYRSREWRQTRSRVIYRDGGCDLGIIPIHKPIKVLVHHINPITIADVENMSPKIFDLENLITTTHDTHNGIHYSDDNFLRDRQFVTRQPNDMIPWK